MTLYHKYNLPNMKFLSFFITFLYFFSVSFAKAKQAAYFPISISTAVYGRLPPPTEKSHLPPPEKDPLTRLREKIARMRDLRNGRKYCEWRNKRIQNASIKSRKMLFRFQCRISEMREREVEEAGGRLLYVSKLFFGPSYQVINDLVQSIFYVGISYIAGAIFKPFFVDNAMQFSVFFQIAKDPVEKLFFSLMDLIITFIAK